MSQENSKSWQLNRQVNISTLVQLALLACLIIAGYVNLQSRLDLLQRDVTMLLQSQKAFSQKLEDLSTKSISYEYRLQALERSPAGRELAETGFQSLTPAIRGTK